MFLNTSESTIWQIIAPAAPLPHTAVPGCGTGCPCQPPGWTPTQGQEGLEQGLSQQEQLWGTEREICERNSRPGQSGWRRQVAAGQVGECRARHCPLSSPRHQLTKIKEKLLWPNSPCRVAGMSSLAPGSPACLDGAGVPQHKTCPRPGGRVIVLIHRKLVKGTRETPEITKAEGQTAICRACPSPG